MFYFVKKDCWVKDNYNFEHLYLISKKNIWLKVVLTLQPHAIWTIQTIILYDSLNKVNSTLINEQNW